MEKFLIDEKEIETQKEIQKKYLEEAGLPTDSREVLGRKYEFVCFYKFCWYTLNGTIQSINYIKCSDDGFFSLSLEVSNRHFGGWRMERLEWNPNMKAWGVCLCHPGSGGQDVFLKMTPAQRDEQIEYILEQTNSKY